MSKNYRQDQTNFKDTFYKPYCSQYSRANSSDNGKSKWSQMLEESQKTNAHLAPSRGNPPNINHYNRHNNSKLEFENNWHHSKKYSNDSCFNRKTNFPNQKEKDRYITDSTIRQNIGFPSRSLAHNQQIDNRQLDKMQMVETNTNHKAGLSNTIIHNQSQENVENADRHNKQTYSNDNCAPKAKPVRGLDGLRSLAIIGVMLYHLSFTWAKGGLIGVTVFFVLSGYLITSIIINEIDTTGSLNIKRFWIRRIRRLLPAVALVIVLCLILFAICNRVLLTKMRPDVIPSLVWMQNWWYIFRGLSYFDNLGDPSPIIHFWSLSIEEQFYLIWPILVIVMKKLKCSNKFIAVICVLLAIFSATAMFMMYNPDADPTRVYYGTDTRAFSLLIGAFFAVIYPWQKRNEDYSYPIMLANRYVLFPTIVEIVGVLSVTVIVIIIVLDNM